MWDQLVLKEDVLYRHFVSADDAEDCLQLVVPRSLQENVFNCLFSLWDQLVLKEDVLYRHFVSADDAEDCLQLVPRSLQEIVLRQIHDNGHLGQEKTLSRVKQKFYWPGHFNDIKN